MPTLWNTHHAPDRWLNTIIQFRQIYLVVYKAKSAIQSYGRPKYIFH